MITNQHNDGCCFKLTVIHYEQTSREDAPEKTHVMYGDNENELWAYFTEVRHIFGFVTKIVIEDDSK